MNKRERVLCALRGGTPDRVPSLFSLHFPHEAAYGQAAVDAHARFYRETDCDILKVMNEHLMPFIGEIRVPEDWRRVRALGPQHALVVDQADLVKRVMDAAKPEYTVATIHGVCASSIHPIEAHYGYEAGRDVMVQTLREHRDIMLEVHRKVADSMCEMVRACVAAGADGIYYAALGAEARWYTDEEFAECIKPYDLQIMRCAKEAGAHVFLHMCKDGLNMERYRDYAPLADVVNWGVDETHFSLEEGRRLFPGRTVLGGLANRSGVLVDGTEAEIAAAVREIIDGFGPQGLILGADCTLPTEIPTERIAAAVHAAVIK